MANVTAKDLEAVVELFDRSDWEELHIDIDGLTVDLSKRDGVRRVVERRSRADSAPLAPAAGAPAPRPAPAQVPVRAPGKAEIPAGWLAVRAPNLGTFYRAPKPGAPPFVETGGKVSPETEVCIIEVMKLFTSVNAGVHGIVRQVCVADGEMVEHDQLLFLVEPSGNATAPAAGS